MYALASIMQRITDEHEENPKRRDKMSDGIQNASTEGEQRSDSEGEDASTWEDVTGNMINPSSIV